MEVAQALLHLHAALVAARTLEAALMVRVPLEVVHTLVVPTALEALTLVEVTLAVAAKARACGLQR